MADPIKITIKQPPKVLVKLASGPVGPPGPAGDGAEPVFQALAAVPIGGGRAVYFDSLGHANYASADNPASVNTFAGITKGAADAGDVLNIVPIGEIIDGAWSWVPDEPIYLGFNGLLTQTPPAAPASSFALILGYPTTATRVFFNPRNPIALI